MCWPIAPNRKQRRKKLADADQRFDKQMNDYHINDRASAEDRQLLEAEKAMMTQYREGRSRILALSRSNQTEQASALINSDFSRTAVQLMEAVQAHSSSITSRPTSWLRTTTAPSIWC
jgi:methyl-accepting chemotaxis protein